MNSLTLRTARGVCEILFDVGYRDFASRIDAGQIVVVTDENVDRLYHRVLAPYPLVVVQAGEENKTVYSVQEIHRRFLGLELDREAFVVGFGGGVVCDLVGLAASTYLRGLAFGFVPTTLLAQLDAAIGGKNGVNLDGYKNLVGTFCQPRFVLEDPSLLATLPRFELGQGLAEAIKHAAIADRELFAFLQDNLGQVVALDREAVARVISDCVRIKTTLVAEDEDERIGRRALLNFGHTIGHALERATGLPHGEAVGLGMIAAANLSVRRGILPPDEAAALKALIAQAGLPTRVKADRDAVLDAIGKDKKRHDRSIRMVLLNSLGHAELAEVSRDEIAAMCHELRG